MLSKYVDDRLLIVLSCQPLKEAGEFEKLGSPVNVEEAGASVNPPAQRQATNLYPGQQPLQQVQQHKHSQYAL